MSHILLKKVQDNLISAPASNYVKFFSNDSDNGLLYYMDSSGVPTAVGGGGSGTSYTPVVYTTYSSLYSLYQSQSFATGSYYMITDFDSVYDQPDFYFDGTPKTSLTTKGKPAIPYQPIVVMATSKSTLSPDAYQPYYPKDKIKYDISWRYTETHTNAKGRITERIDANGNRTDYDHRTIRFKRYQSYERNGLALSGTITNFNCITGVVTGSGTSFTSLSSGDIIILDSSSAYGGDLTYTIGLMVRTITSNTSMTVEVDSLYSGGLPSILTLDSGGQIIPVDYSFSGKNYTYYIATPTGNFDSYKEVYFAQNDFADYDDEVFTFNSTGYGASIHSGVVNNYIGNYSDKYLNGVNNTLILPNNVFIGSDIFNNNILGSFYNNSLSNQFVNNNIFNPFYNNITLGDFSNNTIYSLSFNDNLIDYGFNHNFISGDLFAYNVSKGGSSKNSIDSTFVYNIIDSNFDYNFIKSSSFSYNIIGEDSIYNDIRSDVDNCHFNSGVQHNDIKTGCNLTSTNFTSSTIVYGNYTKIVFRNSNGDIKISYYDAANVLVVNDVTD